MTGTVFFFIHTIKSPRLGTVIASKVAKLGGTCVHVVDPRSDDEKLVVVVDLPLSTPLDLVKQRLVDHVQTNAKRLRSRKRQRGGDSATPPFDPALMRSILDSPNTIIVSVES